MKHIVLKNPISVLSGGAVVGKREAQGPLGACFDYAMRDGHFGQKTWEKAECEMQGEAVRFALEKAGVSRVDCIFSGDLLNQCVASSFAHRASNTAYVGLYGACSTFAEGLALAALGLNAGYLQTAAVSVSSHFCSAERQYRYPNEYGGLRTPTAQWTVTGAGCAVLGADARAPRVTGVTLGKIVDRGISDVNHMGGAMAPAAHDTIRNVLASGFSPEDFDLIVTGDLGKVGSDLLEDLFRIEDRISIKPMHFDCGCAIFDESQDVKSGGSGAGCSAVVFASHLLPKLQSGTLRRILFAGTGALLSPLTVQQGESIPCICHAVVIEGVV